jgi:DNA mismatch endonuclease (patch repair protein)
MRAVKSRDTSPELAVRKILTAMGYRYRLHSEKLPGAPDIVFPSRKKVIFVHGCFWHGHSCKRGARIPKTNVTYWRTKIARNIARDKRMASELRRLGWKAKIVWECEVGSPKIRRSLGQYLGPNRLGPAKRHPA